MENFGFKVKVICDSISPDGKRITTLQLRYPRFIHAEFMTHRVFSRNASSSRAIPVAKMIEQVRDEPAMPIHWGKNQPGMQANEELTGVALMRAKARWKIAAEVAADNAEIMMEVGAHKQVVNRILEPFQFISVVVTATEWDNFFELRAHKDAQPEIQYLARMMKKAMEESTPVELAYGEWHVPYVEWSREVSGSQRFLLNGEEITLADALKCSAACCARTSYNNHDGTSATLEKNVQLHDMLVVAEPKHASPVEHQATPIKNLATESHLQGNLSGWIQYRKIVEIDSMFTAFNTKRLIN